MPELGPLIDSAAYWIAVDAGLRMFWSAIGAVFVIVLTVLIGLAGRALIIGITPPKRKDR